MVKADVVELDSSNFDFVALDKTKNVLVEFYAPCKDIYMYSMMLLNWCCHVSPQVFILSFCHLASAVTSCLLCLKYTGWRGGGGWGRQRSLPTSV